MNFIGIYLEAAKHLSTQGSLGQHATDSSPKDAVRVIRLHPEHGCLPQTPGIITVAAVNLLLQLITGHLYS